MTTAAATTFGIGTLQKRWERLVLAGEAAWLIYLIFGLVQTSLVAEFPLASNSLGERIDIPYRLANALLAQGIHMDTGQPASLAYNTYFPAMGYYVFCYMAGITAIAAAVMGRWILFFTCLAALLVPASLFGASAGVLAGMAVIATVVAVGRCVFKRGFRMILPAVAACILTFSVQTYTSAKADFRPTIRITEAPDDAELARIAALEKAMHRVRAAAPGMAADITYVRAQIAYIQDDRAALVQIGQVPADRVETTPFTPHRLRVVNTAVAHTLHPPTADTLQSHVLRAIANLLIIPVVLLLFITKRLGWRMRKITKMAEALKGLPPLRAATA